MAITKNIFAQLKFVNLTNVNPQAIHKAYHSLLQPSPSRREQLF